MNSFDITSEIDMQEVDNAINQAQKEVAQRYDFKGSPATIELDQKNKTLTLTAEDKFKIGALWEIVQTRMVRRNVPVKNLKPGEIEPASAGTVRQVFTLQVGIPTETAQRDREVPQGRQAQEGAGVHPGRSGPRAGSVARRFAGGHRAASRPGLRHLAAVRQLSIVTVPLERALSKLGLATRTEARALIEAGRVRVDGRTVRDPLAAVIPERIRLDHRRARAERPGACDHGVAQATRRRHDTPRP